MYLLIRYRHMYDWGGSGLCDSDILHARRATRQQNSSARRLRLHLHLKIKSLTIEEVPSNMTCVENLG